MYKSARDDTETPKIGYLIAISNRIAKEPRIEYLINCERNNYPEYIKKMDEEDKRFFKE